MILMWFNLQQVYCFWKSVEAEQQPGDYVADCIFGRPGLTC